jgi:hypothetical protein
MVLTYNFFLVVQTILFLCRISHHTHIHTHKLIFSERLASSNRLVKSFEETSIFMFQQIKILLKLQGILNTDDCLIKTNFEPRNRVL